MKKLQEIIEDQLHFEQGIEAERAHRCEKTMIDRAPNYKRSIIAKFLNSGSFTKCKAQKLRTKGIFMNEDFSEYIIKKRKSLFPRAKKLREERNFAKTNISYLFYPNIQNESNKE